MPISASHRTLSAWYGRGYSSILGSSPTQVHKQQLRVAKMALGHKRTRTVFIDSMRFWDMLSQKHLKVKKSLRASWQKKFHNLPHLTDTSDALVEMQSRDPPF